jgi:hypothetical protein
LVVLPLVVSVSCTEAPPHVGATSRGLPAQIGGEQDLALPVFGPASGGQLAGVGFGGGYYLVVWDAVPAVSGGPAQVIGVRIRASDGAVLDPGGRVLAERRDEYSSGFAGYTAPAVAFDGAGSFAVAFVDGDGPASAAVQRVRMVRVRASNGQVLDAVPPVVSDSFTDCDSPALVSDGGTFLLTWATRGNGVRARRLTGNLGILDVNSLEVGLDYVNAPLSAAVAGGRALVTWSSFYGVRARQVRLSDGMLPEVAPTTLSTATAARWPAVATDGAQFLVVWQDGQAATPDIVGRRMDAVNGTLDPTSTRLHTTGLRSDFVHAHPSLSFGAGQYYLTWIDSSTPPHLIAKGRRIAGDLTISDGPLLDGGTVISEVFDTIGWVRFPRVASSGRDHLVVWRHDEATRAEQFRGIRGQRVDLLTGLPIDTASRQLSTQATAQDHPSIVASDGQYFVVWRERRTDPTPTAPWELFGARLSARDGASLDSGGIRLATGVGSPVPRSAASGTNYLTVWTSTTNEIRGARTSTAGVLLDPSPRLIGSGGWGASVGYGGGRYLAAWADGMAVRATRIDADTGAALDVPPLLLGSDPGNSALETAVGCEATTCWVVMARVGATRPLQAVRIRMSDGAILDQPAQTIDARTGHAARSPAIASNGTAYLLVWADNTLTSYSEAIRAQLFTANTAAPLGSPFLLADAAFPQDAPAVTFDGKQFVVVWQDARNTPTTSPLIDVYGSRVALDGTVIEGRPNGDGVLLTATDLTFNQERRPTPGVASAGLGRALLVYGRAVFDPTVANPRVKGRLIVDEMGVGASCTAPLDCLTGFCVDGVCCDQACGGGAAGDGLACSRALTGSEHGFCAAELQVLDAGAELDGGADAGLDAEADGEVIDTGAGADGAEGVDVAPSPTDASAVPDVEPGPDVPVALDAALVPDATTPADAGAAPDALAATASDATTGRSGPDAGEQEAASGCTSTGSPSSSPLVSLFAVSMTLGWATRRRRLECG